MMGYMQTPPFLLSKFRRLVSEQKVAVTTEGKKKEERKESEFVSVSVSTYMTHQS